MNNKSIMKTPGNEFIALLKQSKVIDKKSLTITSYNFMALGIVMTIISLLIFEQLTDIIYSLSDIKVNNIIFDKRYGYTFKEVLLTLESWGPKGRLYYIFIELWDMTFYFSAYCTAFIVMINRTCDSIIKNSNLTENNIQYLKRFGHFPQILVLIDTMEDIFQITFTLLYHYELIPKYIGMNLFQSLVFSGSIFNTIKWNLVRLGIMTFFTLIIWMIYANYITFLKTYNEMKKKK